MTLSFQDIVKYVLLSVCTIGWVTSVVAADRFHPTRTGFHDFVGFRSGCGKSATTSMPPSDLVTNLADSPVDKATLSELLKQLDAKLASLN